MDRRRQSNQAVGSRRETNEAAGSRRQTNQAAGNRREEDEAAGGREGHGDTIRGFIAIELSASARAAVGAVIDGLRRGPGGDAVRWVPEENLHVTLRFLGEVAADRVDRICAEVGAAIAGIAPFELAIEATPCAFPRRRPHAVIFEVAPTEPVEALAAAVEAGVRTAGVEPETRRFRPHLTLGRARRGQRLPQLGTGGSDLEAPCGDARAFTVDAAVLFRSELGSSGARYTALRRVPFASDGAAREFTPQPDERSKENSHGS